MDGKQEFAQIVFPVAVAHAFTYHIPERFLEDVAMPNPGEYVPDSTEGITRVEDLPKAKTIRRSRN